MAEALGLPGREAFAAAIGTAFDLEAGPEGGCAVELVAVESADVPGFEVFSLVFCGATASILPQAVYPLRHPALGAFELFLVPVGRTGALARYEAVCNRPAAAPQQGAVAGSRAGSRAPSDGEQGGG